MQEVVFILCGRSESPTCRRWSTFTRLHRAEVLFLRQLRAQYNTCSIMSWWTQVISVPHTRPRLHFRLKTTSSEDKISRNKAWTQPQNKPSLSLSFVSDTTLTVWSKNDNWAQSFVASQWHTVFPKAALVWLFRIVSAEPWSDFSGAGLVLVSQSANSPAKRPFTVNHYELGLCVRYSK